MAKKRLLWVGWDGADWEHITPLLDAGELPNLERLINNGVMGNLATHHPVLSPMLWNTAATGKHAYKHGILGFAEPDKINGGARPFQSTSRSTKAIWNILSQNGYRSNVVNWWASHPAEPINGCIVSNMLQGIRFEPGNDWTWPTGLIHPPEIARELVQFKVFAEELSGEEVLPFVPDGKNVCQDDDPRLALLANHLAEMLSTQGIATALMEKEDWDFMAVYFTAIDHFCHSFMNYYPPRLTWVSEEDFDMYRHVIPAVYRLSDMMLGRMIDLAGPDATIVVCSDHGFQSGPLRLMQTPNEPAGPAFWHRQYGIFVASGPEIKRDERVYSATLADICPTILAIYGLPIGEDMDGRVLTDIFELLPSTNTVPSWDAIEGNGKDGMHHGDVAASPEEAHELFQQFVALGYVDAPGESKQENADSADIECKYNLARNLNALGRHEQAVPLFLELVQKSPWESRFIIHLARTLASVGRLEDAETVLSRAFDLAATEDPTVRLILAEIKAAQGHRQASFSELCTIEQQPYLGPGVLMHVGMCFLNLQKFIHAERVFRRILSIHPDHAEALQGLSTVLVRKGENQEAAEAAMAAVSLLYRLPQAHFNLGVALIRGGDPKSASVAFETALKFSPFMPKAHRWLQYIYSSMVPDQENAEQHKFNALQQSISRSKATITRVDRQIEARTHPIELPVFPSEQERINILAKKRPIGNSKFVQSAKVFTIVSGLPRSGTSVLMQMLAAGGLPAKTDGTRAPDVDNPRGYLEWEDVKKIGSKPEIFDEVGLEGFAIKVVSPLLNQLPYQHRYKVIFMNRSVEEVVASQAKMIDRLNTAGALLNDEQLSYELEMHRLSAIEWLQRHPRADVLVVEYVELLSNPEPWIQKIVDFVGADRLPFKDTMKSVIQTSLRRNRI